MKRDVRLAQLLLVLVLSSAVTASAWQVWASRQRVLNETAIHSLNLAQALNTYAEGVFTESAMLLLGVAERLAADGYAPEHLQRIQTLVAVQSTLLTQLNGFFIFDAGGQLLMSARGAPDLRFNSADRAYFQHHRDHPSLEVFIGPPIRSRSQGEWVITVSRRLQDEGGRFAGVVVVTLSIENFLKLFGKIDIGSSGVIALTSNTGQLLVRYPFREQDVGHDFSKSDNFRKHYLHAASGTATFRSGLDGTERLYAFRRSDRHPIVTTVAAGRDEALQSWRFHAAVTVAVVSGLLLLMAGGSWRLILNMKRRMRAEASLVAAQGELLQANRQLEVLAIQDPLTGLANRRCFDQRLSQECRRAARDGAPLSLLLADLDHFKAFNDRYGHVAGDQCLQAVAEVFRQCAKRPGDLAARYGGEELALVLPNTDLEGALAIAAQLLAGLRALGLPHAASPLGQVSASIGVASVQGQPAEDGEQGLIEAADAALYRAKTAGRNGVMA